MAKNGTAAYQDTTTMGDINVTLGIPSTDIIFPFALPQDGKSYNVYHVYPTTAANAAALNAATTSYAIFPNGSIATCGTTSVIVAKKGGTLGQTDGAWA